VVNLERVVQKVKVAGLAPRLRVTQSPGVTSSGFALAGQRLLDPELLSRLATAKGVFQNLALFEADFRQTNKTPPNWTKNSHMTPWI
jgi:hypothetical protein